MSGVEKTYHQIRAENMKINQKFSVHMRQKFEILLRMIFSALENMLSEPFNQDFVTCVVGTSLSLVLGEKHYF